MSTRDLQRKSSPNSARRGALVAAVTMLMVLGNLGNLAFAGSAYAPAHASGTSWQPRPTGARTQVSSLPDKVGSPNIFSVASGRGRLLPIDRIPMGAGGPPASRLSVATPSVVPAGRVINTLDLLNGTLLPGNFRPVIGASPDATVYDPENKLVYVANQASDNLAAVNGTTNQVVGFISVGAGPDGIAFDSANGFLYVADFSANALSIVDATTSRAVLSVPVGLGPEAVAYDPANSHVYVADAYSDNVTVLDAATDTVVGSVSVGSFPDALAYDQANGLIYVVNNGGTNGGTLTAINGTTDQIVGSVSGLGGNPDGIAYDSTSSLLYVSANFQVTIVNGSRDVVVDTIPLPPFVGSTGGVAFDPAEGYLYVAGLTAPYLFVISAATNTLEASVPVGDEPKAVSVDPATGGVFVANFASDNVSLINGATDSGVGSVSLGVSPSAIAYDKTNGFVYAVESSSNDVTVIHGVGEGVLGSIPVGSFPQGIALDTANGDLFIANFNSDNLTVIDGATNRAVGNVTVSGFPAGTILCPRAAAYDKANGDVYVANECAGAGPDEWETSNVTVINGSTSAYVSNIPVGVFPDAVAYDSSNGNVYVVNLLPLQYSGITSNVTVIDGSTNHAVDSVPVGSLPSALAFDPRNGYLYVANSNSSNLSVVDCANGAVVKSIDVGVDPDAVTYNPKDGNVYVANGLSNNVTIINSTTDEVGGSIGVGVSPDAVTFDGADGYILVANAGSGTVSVIGSTYYPVAFREGGLPAGLSWTVSVNGSTFRTNGSSYAFQEPNGTYSFLISGPSGYLVASGAPSGTVTVAGAAVVISFGLVKGMTSTLTFEQRGLPKGQQWCAEIGGWTSCSTTNKLGYTNLTPGMYAYSVAAMSGQTITAKLGKATIPLSGNLSISTRNLNVALTYVYPYAVLFSEVGLSSGEWSVTVRGVTTSTSWSDDIVLELTNGTYPYRIGIVVGHKSLGTPKLVRVTGAPVFVLVTFSAKASHSSRPLLLAGSLMVVPALTRGLWARRRRNRSGLGL